LAARGRGRDRRSREAARSLSRVDACNPLLQAHPTWARDEHEGHGISTSLTPISGHLTSPLRARPRADPSGPGHAATFHSSAQGPPGLETPTIPNSTLTPQFFTSAPTVASCSLPQRPESPLSPSLRLGGRSSPGSC
jgi:hypothetical protein